MINNAVAAFSSRIPDKVRNMLLNASVFVLLYIGILKYSNQVLRKAGHYSDLIYNAGVLALIMIAVLGMHEKKNFKRLKINRAFWAGWLLCFAMIFVMSFVNPVKKDYLFWSVTGLFIFPLIFIGWSSRNRFKELIGTFSVCVLIASYFFIILSLVLVPFLSRGELGEILSSYIGMAVNPNNNGMIVIGFYGPILYLLLSERRRNKVCYLIPMGFCLGIAVISDCRTAELGILLQSGAGLLYFYLSCVRNSKHRVNMKSFVLSVVMVIIIAFISGLVMDRLDRLDLDIRTYAASEVNAVSGDESFSTLDRLSSGRLTKTRYFLEQSTFWGNGSPEGPIMEGHPDSKWAFNNAVDILYISGVIPFAGCVLWLITVIVFCIRCVFGRIPRRPEYLFTVVTFSGYFVEFMLEVTIYPLTTSLVLLAYIGFIPVACRGENNDRIN